MDQNLQLKDINELSEFLMKQVSGFDLDIPSAMIFGKTSSEVTGAVFSILSTLAYVQQHDPRTLYTADCKGSRLWDTLHNCCVSFSYHLTLHGVHLQNCNLNYNCSNQESYKGNVAFLLWWGIPETYCIIDMALQTISCFVQYLFCVNLYHTCLCYTVIDTRNNPEKFNKSLVIHGWQNGGHY